MNVLDVARERGGDAADVEVGPFRLPLWQGWTPVHAPWLGRDDVLLFDVRPETAHRDAGLMHPNVAVRYYHESESGNVASAALREAFEGGRGVTDGSLLLSYEAFFVGSGLPARRHHRVVWRGDRLWHSLQWFVGLGAVVLEMTLTVSEGDDLDLFGEQCDYVMRRVRVPSEAQGSHRLIWPQVPADVSDPLPASIVTEQGLVPDQAESLVKAHAAGMRRLAGSMFPWSSEMTVEQKSVVSGNAPVLSAVGMQSGTTKRVELCSSGHGHAVLLVVTESPGTAGRGVAVTTVPEAFAVPVLMRHLGVRTDWLRDAVFRAEAEAAPSLEGGWHVASGGAEASALLSQERDWWTWRDRQGEIAAEWFQPAGAPPFAVARDEDGCTAVPVVPGILYAALQCATGFSTASEAR